MTATRLLDELFRASAAAAPSSVAVRFDGQDVTYGAIDQCANRMASHLKEAGVGHGDRVGLWLSKSPVAIAAMQATLRLGAAYVPIDPQSPGVRATSILTDCTVAALITTEARAALLAGDATAPRAPNVIVDDTTIELPSWGEGEVEAFVSQGSQDELAYILYTSGSTGKPKGVEISHLNALAFIDWAVEFVDATATDRFSNHAPFHFDLSVLDLYAAFSVGAAVCIIPPALSYAPGHLLELMVSERMTIWYSVPSALIMMMDHADLLERETLPLRHLLFAGEPFPIAKLRPLRKRWPSLPMHNLYGPTETNVCTAFTVGDIDDDRSKPVPIGSATCGDEVWALTASGERADVGEEGELYVKGPTVMLGYYGHPRTGGGPYATGDLVRRIDAVNFEYIGRKDQMLKLRGHRIEAGEVEACLLAHPRVGGAAVVIQGSGINARLVAYLVEATDISEEEKAKKRPGIIALKQHCAERLPRSMVVDRAYWLDELPRTRNGKIDRRKLASGDLS